MDSSVSLIEHIIEKTNKQVEAFTQKIQNMMDTADFTNPAVSNQFQLLMNQLTLVSNSGSALAKAFKDVCQATIQRIG